VADDCNRAIHHQFPISHQGCFRISPVISHIQKNAPAIDPSSSIQFNDSKLDGIPPFQPQIAAPSIECPDKPNPQGRLITTATS
jgi:hypothetical protein